MDLEVWDSKTYKVRVGCGNVFITIVKNDGQVIRVITYWKTTFHCDVTFFDALNRQTSFQTNRELEQAIKDLKGNDSQKEGHFCCKYSVSVKGYIKQNKLGAYSCADAIARVLEKEIA